MPHRSPLGDLPQQLRLEGSPSCADCLKPSEAREFGVDLSHYCDGHHCFSPKRFGEKFYEVLDQIEGWHFPNLRHRVRFPKLPSLIPAYDGDDKLCVPPSSLGKCVAISLARLAGTGFDSFENFRERHGLPPDSTLLFHLEGKDQIQDRYYKRILRDGILARVLQLENRMVVSPGFSVISWGQQCRNWQLTNLKLMVNFCAEANLLGLPAAPLISAAHMRDIDRLTTWIIDQGSKVQFLAINFQGLSQSQVEATMELIPLIESRVDMTFKWILFGICSSDRMRLALSHAERKRLHFVSRHPVVAGQRGRSLYRRPDDSVSRRLIIEGNLAHWRESWRIVCDQVAGREIIATGQLDLFDTSGTLRVVTKGKG